MMYISAYMQGLDKLDIIFFYKLALSLLSCLPQHQMAEPRFRQGTVVRSGLLVRRQHSILLGIPHR